MGALSAWHWIILLVVAGSVLVFIGYPVARILKRMGFSRWWALLAFIPYLNVAALWIVAFIRWPSDQET